MEQHKTRFGKTDKSNRPRLGSEENLVRHCKKRHAVRKNDVVVGVYPDFFSLRRFADGTIESYLSAQYYEFEGAAHLDRMKHAMNSTRLKSNKGDAFVQLSIGEIEVQGFKKGRKLRALHLEPKKSSYSGIFGLPFPNDDDLNGLLSAYAVVYIIDQEILSKHSAEMDPR